MPVHVGDKFVAAEAIVLHAMRQGAPALLAAARAEMAAQVRRLRQCVAPGRKSKDD